MTANRAVLFSTPPSGTTALAIDFSHLSRISLPLYAKAVERGDVLTDECFESILNAIEPPLFEPTRMKTLHSELCWFAPRAHKGRPPKGCRRNELAAAVDQLDRSDVPKALLKAIAARLKCPAEKHRLSKPWQALQKRKRASRDSLIFYINRAFVEALITGAEPRLTEISEYVDRERGTTTPHSAALKLTHDFLRERLKEDPPSLARMRNIISEKSSRDFVKARGSNVA